MITGPFFRWFGSKWNASKHYPPPTHRLIIEPFAGCAPYSLRHYEHDCIIAEANEHLYKLWQWLINDATEDAIRSIPLNIPEGTDIRSLGLSEGQSLLLKSWQRTNNVGNCWTISPWGNKPGQWTATSRSRVAEQHTLIKHWKVQQNGFPLLASTSHTATWFIDPPYQYNYKYRLPFVENYKDFGQLILRQKGQIIACEAHCTKTGIAPAYLPFETFRDTVTSRRKAHQSHHSKELLFHRP